jgi:CelD/BcsL family acetyltransferase involved in cellulose biosynthesis
LALEPDSPDPIGETPVLHPDEVFDYHCRDMLGLQHAARVASDPAWDYDPNGLLVHRRPDGEIEVYLPHSLHHKSPYAIVHPLAEDGSDLSGGVSPDFSHFSPEPSELSTAKAASITDPPSIPIRTRILWNPHSPHRALIGPNATPSGLALATELPNTPETVIPAGTEDNEGAVTGEELRTA